MPPKKEPEIQAYPALELGQDAVRRFLESMRRERIPSLLFSGPVGSGKEYTAIEFARMLNCERDEPCDISTHDLCESCTKTLYLEHRDIHLVYPTPTQGSGEGEDGDVGDIAKVLDEKRLDIFARYEFTKKASIRVARSRAVIQRANMKPLESRYNVFILIDAHAMREEAQNALLKVVEEPPPHSAVLFVTHNPEAILYTIRSRCQTVRFTPLRADVIETVLVDYYDVPAKTARKAATLSQGNIQRALRLVESFDDDDRDAAAAFVFGVIDKPESWAIGRALDAGRGANRDRVARYLHELSIVFRDLMVADKDHFVNGDLAAQLAKHAPRWEQRRIPRLIDRIGTARHEVLVRNMNIDGTLVKLFMDIKAASEGVEAV